MQKTSFFPQKPAIGARHHVDLILVPGFHVAELSAVLDVVDSVNRLLETHSIALSIVSPDGGTIVAADTRVSVSSRPAEFETGPGLAVFAGGDMAKANSKRLGAISRKAEHAGRRLVVLSNAVCALHEAGRFRDDPVVVPWDDLYVEEAGWPELMTSELLYMQSGKVTTCAGRVATFDLMVTLLCDVVGLSAPTEITDQLKMSDIRTPLARQRKATRHRYRIENEAFARAVEIMEDTLEDPLSMPELAEMVGMSVRQIERNFKKTFGLSPVKFRRQKQVQKARWLVDNTGLSVTEIAMACGFSSQSQLAKHFKTQWGTTVLERRVQVRKDRD